MKWTLSVFSRPQRGAACEAATLETGASAAVRAESLRAAVLMNIGSVTGFRLNRAVREVVGSEADG